MKNIKHKKHIPPFQELKDPQCRDEMAAARGALKKNATMLYTASQAFLRHPDVAATRANRDYVFKQVQEAIGGISSAAQATSPTDEKHGHAGIGELAAALNEFDVSQQKFCDSFSSLICSDMFILYEKVFKMLALLSELHWLIQLFLNSETEDDCKHFICLSRPGCFCFCHANST